MTCLSPHQHRALAAAAGLVGRPLLLSLTVACGASLGDPDETSAPATTTTSSTTTTATSSTSEAITTSGATNHATSSTSTSDGATTGATLLTDASTTFATTGDDTTTTTGPGTTGSDSTGSTGDATTGGLDDCILDPRTQEVDWACCEAQNWMPAPQCTPWGPPAPPSLSPGLLARARALRTELA